MIKKTIISIISFVFLFSLAGSVSAQFEWLPGAGITPDSKLYFLDKWGEKIGMFFAFSEERKIEKSFRYAEERLSEIEKMSDKAKDKIPEEALDNYEKHMNKAQERLRKMEEKGEKIDSISEKVANATSRHFEVLQDVMEKAPEKAKKGLSKALEASGKGHKQALESLAEKDPQKAADIISEKAKERLERIEKKVEENKIDNVEKEVENYKKYLYFGSGFFNQLENKVEGASDELKQKAKRKFQNEVGKHKEKLEKIMNRSSKKIRQRIEKGLGNGVGLTKPKPPVEDDEENSKDKDEDKKGEFCIQVITPAKNLKTGECKEFPTPCDVPEGWEKVNKCGLEENDEVKSNEAQLKKQGLQSR